MPRLVQIQVQYLYTQTTDHISLIYYPILVIIPVGNNEHQRIDDVSTDHVS